MIDIRVEGIKKNLENKKIIVICGSKGGVGKSTLTFLLSLVFSRFVKVGVCDLDFTGSSLHIIFNSTSTFKEEDGIVLPEVLKNVFLLSVNFFSKDNPLALRGEEITDVFLELLTITNWKDINLLLFDTPPTLTDPILDIFRFLPKAEFWVVSSNSILSFHTTLKFVKLLKEMKKEIPILFVNRIFENDVKGMDVYEELAKNFEKVVFVPFIKDLESFYIDPYKLFDLEITLFNELQYLFTQFLRKEVS